MCVFFTPTANPLCSQNQMLFLKCYLSPQFPLWSICQMFFLNFQLMLHPALTKIIELIVLHFYPHCKCAMLTKANLILKITSFTSIPSKAHFLKLDTKCIQSCFLHAYYYCSTGHDNNNRAH